MSYQVSFGGIVLDGIARWEETMQSRVAVDTFPRRQGGIVPSVPFKSPKQGRFNFVIYKDSESALLAYIDSLKRTLEEGIGQIILRDDSRYLRAVKTNFGIAHDVTQMPSQVATGFVEFVAGDPFWYSSAGEQTTTESNVASSPHAFSATNDGGALTPIRIEIKALTVDKTGTFKLTNTTIGLVCQYTGTVLADQTLLIDCAASPFVVQNGGTNGLKDFAGSFLSLVAGLNNFSYDGPTGVDVTLSWTERWN